MTHYVYRCLEKDGRLVYVGESRDPWARLEHHRANAHWAPLVSKVKITVHPDRPAALAAERQAIADEDPRFNVTGRWRTRYRWTKADFEDYAEGILRGAFYTDTSRRRFELLSLDYQSKFSATLPQAERFEAALRRHHERTGRTLRAYFGSTV